MTKAELAAKIAVDAHASTPTAMKALDAFVAAVSKSLAKEGRMALPGLGVFTVAKRAARVGRNPQTQEPIKIPACNAVKFAAAKALKEAIQ